MDDLKSWYSGNVCVIESNNKVVTLDLDDFNDAREYLRLVRQGSFERFDDKTLNSFYDKTMDSFDDKTMNSWLSPRTPHVEKPVTPKTLRVEKPSRRYIKLKGRQ